ncbi:ABC transporter transmembrane domain-containing protein [Eisenbergiella porci]|uniref:ABC transporter transmembrane domain-containing protein n=1 Tax=Eisenbergiella porci TaxID=2652274 RepID=UPI0022E58921|nr:ABC transporter transmembrane domain-containing protein [Eisenbergiella porci]
MHLLKTLLHKRKYLISTAVLLNILSVLWTLLWNIQLRHIIDSVSKGQVIPGNMVVRALMLIAAISIFSLLSESISGLSCEVMTHDLRMGFAGRLAEMSLPELEQINAGDAVRFAGTLILLLSVCPLLTAGAYLPVAGIVAYVFYSSKIIGRLTQQEQEARKKMDGYVDIILTLFPIIRIYDAAGLLWERFREENRIWGQAAEKREKTAAELMSLSALLSSIPVLLLLLLGGYLTQKQVITTGTLYLFLNLSGNVTGIMMNMPGHIAAFRKFKAHMERLEPHISMDPDIFNNL